MQERILIRRLKQHQPQALEELIETYSPYVGTIVRNIIGKYLSESDVEELTADVFLAVWEHTDQLKAGKLTAYLAAIARNRAKNRIRGYHETVNLEDMIEIGSGEDLEDAIDRKILGELLRDVLDTLTEKDREILIRYYYCYENVRQIAETLCLTHSVSSQYNANSRRRTIPLRTIPTSI